MRKNMIGANTKKKIERNDKERKMSIKIENLNIIPDLWKAISVCLGVKFKVNTDSNGGRLN